MTNAREGMAAVMEEFEPQLDDFIVRLDQRLRRHGADALARGEDGSEISASILAALTTLAQKLVFAASLAAGTLTGESPAYGTRVVLQTIGQASTDLALEQAGSPTATAALEGIVEASDHMEGGPLIAEIASSLVNLVNAKLNEASVCAASSLLLRGLIAHGIIDMAAQWWGRLDPNFASGSALAAIERLALDAPCTFAATSKWTTPTHGATIQ